MFIAFIIALSASLMAVSAHLYTVVRLQAQTVAQTITAYQQEQELLGALAVVTTLLETRWCCISWLWDNLLKNYTARCVHDYTQ